MKKREIVYREIGCSYAEGRRDLNYLNLNENSFAKLKRKYLEELKIRY
jgi:hypothetical protein